MQYSSTGMLLHRYGVSSARGVALTPDGSAFWEGGPGNVLRRVSLSNPWVAEPVVAFEEHENESIIGIAVVGEWRAATAVPRMRAVRR
jgi:hypothetical protein